jgi:hypothetical protein
MQFGSGLARIVARGFSVLGVRLALQWIGRLYRRLVLGLGDLFDGTAGDQLRQERGRWLPCAELVIDAEQRTPVSPA